MDDFKTQQRTNGLSPALFGQSKLLLIHPDYYQYHKPDIIYNLVQCHGFHYIRLTGQQLTEWQLQEQLQPVPHATFVIDDADVATSTAWVPVLRRLLMTNRVVLMGRQLPFDVWQVSDLREMTCMYPMNCFFPDYLKTRQPLLEIYALSHRQPRLNGQILHTFDNAMRYLVMYLLTHHLDYVSRGELQNAITSLPPDAWDEKVTLEGLVTKINRTLDDVLIETQHEMLSIQKHLFSIYYDLWMLERAILAAKTHQEIEPLRHLMLQLRQPLSIVSQSKKMFVHRQILDTWAWGHTLLAQSAHEQGHINEARWHYLTVLAHLPHRTDIQDALGLQDL